MLVRIRSMDPFQPTETSRLRLYAHLLDLNGLPVVSGGPLCHDSNGGDHKINYRPGTGRYGPALGGMDERLSGTYHVAPCPLRQRRRCGYIKATPRRTRGTYGLRFP